MSVSCDRASPGRSLRFWNRVARGGSKIAPGARCCHLEEELQSRVSAAGRAPCRKQTKLRPLFPQPREPMNCRRTVHIVTGGLQHQLHLLLSGATFRFRCWSDPRFPSRCQEQLFKRKDFTSSTTLQLTTLSIQRFSKPPGRDTALVVVCAKKYIEWRRGVIIFPSVLIGLKLDGWLLGY